MHREKKALKTKMTSSEEEEVTAGLRSASSIFMSPNQTYVFRLSRNGLINSTAGGLIATAVSWTPAGITEYVTYLASMFSEVRILEAKLSVVPILTAQNASGYQGAFALASNLGYTATVPATTQDVLDNPDSKIHPAVNVFAATTDGSFQLTRKVPSDYLWANVATPVPAVNTGCYGQFEIIELDGGGSFAASKPVLSWQFEGWYELRSRD